MVFVDDITLPGSLCALTVRSPFSKGRLRELIAPALPSGYTLIQGADIPGVNQLDAFPVPILTAQALSYKGEPVALLVGPDMGRLQEYAAQCQVMADKEQPMFFEDPQAEALAQRILTIPPLDMSPPEGEPQKNIRGTYETGIQEPWYADTQGVVAVYTAEPCSVVIHTATQWPFHIARSVAAALRIPVEAVRVKPTALGMHLDGKLWYPSLIACQAALGSYLTGKPVKFVLTREEDFRYAPKRHRTAIHIQSVLGKTGTIRETQITLKADLGAHGVFIDEILDRTCLGSLGAYKLGALTLNGSAVTTNIPPQGPLEGFGLSQGFFAIERQISRMADALGQDPAVFRKAHIFPKQSSLGLGVPVKAALAERLIDRAAAKSDYYRKWAAYELLRSHRRGTAWAVKDESPRGIGIALAYQGSGFLYPPPGEGPYALEVSLDADETLSIRAASYTDTWAALWRRIAGELLSLEESRIRLHPLGGVEAVPDCGPMSNSRYPTELTALLHTACEELRQRRQTESLPIRARAAYQPSLKVPWAGHTPIPLTGLYNEQALKSLGWGVAVVEVAIDPIAYTPNIRGIWLCIAGGRLFSEPRARYTVRIAAIQALGWAVQEGLLYVQGKIPEHLFHTYGIPDPGDIPPISVDFCTGPDTGDPCGIGELPFSTIPAAYVQAVSQAMDHPFERIPLGAQAVWEVEHQRKKEAL
ncbi:MAG: xanthine dehydrogenase family protein molybdopterin-binding subunit [Spirochaetaceae bacterium]|nr:xanthine dehydrogenase family protein molybdopterin-binding subunit [Spirochaetaceae bacterium]